MSPDQELDLLTSSSDGRSSTSSTSSSFTSNSSTSSIESSPPRDDESLYTYRCLRSFIQEEGGQKSSSVFCLALHQGLLFGGLGSNQISVWRGSTGSQLCTLRSPPHAGAVKALAMSGDRLFSAHQDHKIRVWRVSDLQHCLVATLPTLRDVTRSFLLFSSSTTTSVHHTDRVSALAVSDKLLYSASWDRSVKVWRLSDFRCLESFLAHSNAVNALVLDSNSGLLYTGSADSTVKIWQRRKTKAGSKHTHNLLAVLQRPNTFSPVNALALSPEGAILYSGSSDSCICAWERLKSEHLVQQPDERKGGGYKYSLITGYHRHAVLCMATLDDLLCSGSADKTILVWRRCEDASYTCLARIKAGGAVKSVTITMDRLGFCNVYGGGLDGETRLWRVNYGKDEEIERTSEHFYFSDGGGGDCKDGLLTGAVWKMKAIRCALEEGVPHFFRLAVQALEC